MSHSEFSIRGSIIDLYPMGSKDPYRIDLFDDEVDSIRLFDTDTQRSSNAVEEIRMLPAREFPTDKAALNLFRQQFLERFDASNSAESVFNQITRGTMPSGVEYYLPLFFEKTATLFDYLPGNTLVFTANGLNDAVNAFDAETRARYEDRRHDRLRPILPPTELFLQPDEVFGQLKHYPRITCSSKPEDGAGASNCSKGESLYTPEYFKFDRLPRHYISNLTGAAVAICHRGAIDTNNYIS